MQIGKVQDFDGEKLVALLTEVSGYGIAWHQGVREAIRGQELSRSEYRDLKFCSVLCCICKTFLSTITLRTLYDSYVLTYPCLFSLRVSHICVYVSLFVYNAVLPVIMSTWNEVELEGNIWFCNVTQVARLKRYH